MMLVMLMRGRPRIDAELITSYNLAPRPSLVDAYSCPSEEVLGSPANDEEYNLWPALIEGVRYQSDSHALKAMGTLVFGAQHLGDTPTGGIIGAFRSSTDGEKKETSRDGDGCRNNFCSLRRGTDGNPWGRDMANQKVFGTKVGLDGTNLGSRGSDVIYQ